MRIEPDMRLACEDTIPTKCNDYDIKTMMTKHRDKDLQED